jgi:hypothetical protein
MPLTNTGAIALASYAVGDGLVPLLNLANAYTGVGDSSTSFSAAHTDLQASSNKLRKGMDPTYPQRSSNVITFRSTYGTSDANYTWNEWAIFNAASSGTMVGRKVEALGGPKTNTQTWILTATCTVQAA